MSLSVERALRRALASLLALGSLLVLAACAREEAEVPELLEPRGVSMDTAVVRRGTIQRTETYEGLVLPGVRELSFSASGLVQEVTVCPGSRVKEGDVLARLDVDAFAAALSSMESYLRYAEENAYITEREQQIQIELARLDLEEQRAAGADASALRLQELQIAEKENSLAEARALWQLDREEQLRSIGEMRERVDTALLTAPCDGTVVSCSTAAGAYAMENAVVILLAEDEALYLSVAPVSPSAVSAASEVYAAVGAQRVEVALRQEGGEDYVVRSGMSAFDITDDLGADVASGMAAVLFVISDRAEDALIVPSSALRYDSGYYVYKIVDGVQVRQSVTRGTANDAEVQILSGLEEGDVVYAGT